MRWLSATRGDRLALDDRGLAYGDGLFETIAVLRGEPRLLDAHLDRLARGCTALGITGVNRLDTARRIRALAATRDDEGWIKLIVTRGSGGRGYAVPGRTEPVGVLSTGPLAPMPTQWRARLCATRLPDAGALAGIKHLNRLPQVLARMELADDEHEGLMCDAGGDVACGIMSNVFVVIGQRVLTPSLARAGVAGVMRRFVCDTVDVTKTRITTGALARAGELFVTNALRGVVSLTRVGTRELPAPTPVADALRAALHELPPR